MSTVNQKPRSYTQGSGAFAATSRFDVIWGRNRPIYGQYMQWKGYVCATFPLLTYTNRLLFLPEDLTGQGFFFFHKLILVGGVVETESVEDGITKLVAVA